MVTKVEKVRALRNGALDQILSAFEKAYDTKAQIEIENLSLQLSIISAANVVLERAKKLEIVKDGMIPVDFDVNRVDEDYKTTSNLQSELGDWSSQI